MKGPPAALKAVSAGQSLRREVESSRTRTTKGSCKALAAAFGNCNDLCDLCPLRSWMDTGERFGLLPGEIGIRNGSFDCAGGPGGPSEGKGWKRSCTSSPVADLPRRPA